MDHAEPPPFQGVKDTLAPSVQSLLKNETQFLIEHGISYCKYVPIKPIDNLELVSSSKLVNFYYKDQSAYINTSRVLLETEFICQNEDGSAITQTDFISANNVMSQSIIDSCILNIGNDFANESIYMPQRSIARSIGQSVRRSVNPAFSSLSPTPNHNHPFRGMLGQ